MSKTVKNTLIIAAAVAVIGLVLAFIGFLFGGMQSVTIGGNGIELTKNNKSESFDETFANISSIDAKVDLRDVIIKEGAEFRVISKGVGSQFSSENKDGVLKISESKKESWINFNLFGFFLGKNTHADLIITCPAGKLDSINIGADSGNIDVSDLNVHNLILDADLGSINLTNVKSELTHCELDSGSLDLKKSDLGSLEFSLSLGDLTAKNLTVRSVKGELDSGKADISGIITGPVYIESDLGDVKLTLSGKENAFSYDLKTDLGSINLNGNKTDGSIIKEYENKPKIKISADAGSVSILFK